ncbi:hypothetical protein AVEN_205680-1 [Araneus ventricosus]|uniref:DUF4817 domain-containing protein n=1 Tax=Araneus ventricosus TaxID=182803 RepID=A0A4Y2RK42_ARAVE|nr:hypothetical protein AVEN_205680-1 [Araneus ventricosus]
MVLIYGECGRKAKSAALYRERFPEGPTYRQTILKVVKRLRETAVHQPTSEFVDLDVGRKAQPEDAIRSRPSSEQHKMISQKIVASQKNAYDN